METVDNKSPSSEDAVELPEAVKELIEEFSEPSMDKEVIDDVQTVVAALEKPPEHLAPITLDEWHGVPEDAGSDLLGALDPVGGFLGALATALGEGATNSILEVRHRWKQQQHLVQGRANRPIVIDPRVSFAPGHGCLVVIKANGDLAILPGSEASSGEHQGTALLPGPARDLARQIRDMPDLHLSPDQADEITAWIDSHRGPTMIIVSPREVPPR